MYTFFDHTSRFLASSCIDLIRKYCDIIFEYKECSNLPSSLHSRNVSTFCLKRQVMSTSDIVFGYPVHPYQKGVSENES